MVFTLCLYFAFYLLSLLFIIWTNFFYQNICFKLDTKLLWQRKLKDIFKPWNHWIVARVIIIGKIIIVVYNQDNVDLYFRQVCCCALYYTIHIYAYTVKKNSKPFSLHKKRKNLVGIEATWKLMYAATASYKILILIIQKLLKIISITYHNIYSLT